MVDDITNDGGAVGARRQTEQGAFEREFEAIKRYEPISRRHPGLVPILQVGRSDEEGFYYYIMELADDVEKGRNIDPETYVVKANGETLVCEPASVLPMAQRYFLF